MNNYPVTRTNECLKVYERKLVGGGGEGEGGKQDKDKIGMQEELNEDLKCKDQKS